MKVVKLINYNKTWKGKDGKDRPSVNYYLEYDILGETKSLCITNKFPRDFLKLDVIAVVRVIGK